MQISEANMRWATRKLSRFMDWPGFPKSKEGLEAYARALLRIVRGKKFREIYEELGVAPPGNIDLEATDLDWLLDAVFETMEEFPKPIALRRMYEQKLPPCEDEPRFEA